MTTNPRDGFRAYPRGSTKSSRHIDAPLGSTGRTESRAEDIIYGPVYRPQTHDGAGKLLTVYRRHQGYRFLHSVVDNESDFFLILGKSILYYRVWNLSGVKRVLVNSTVRRV
jgi:hypothetical protein